MKRTLIGGLPVPWSDEDMRRMAAEYARRELLAKPVEPPKRRPRARRS